MLPVVFYHGIEGAAQNEAVAREQPQQAAEEGGVLAGVACLAAEAVNTLAHALEAAGAGSLPLLLSSSAHAR